MKTFLLLLLVACPVFGYDYTVSNRSNRILHLELWTEVPADTQRVTVPAGATVQIVGQPHFTYAFGTMVVFASGTGIPTETYVESGDIINLPDPEFESVALEIKQTSNSAVSATAYGLTSPDAGNLSLFLEVFWWVVGVGLVGIMFRLIRSIGSQNHSPS